MKLTYSTLEGLYLNNYAELNNGKYAYLEDSSMWEYVDIGLQKKDLVFTLDTKGNELYKVSIYRSYINKTWYMQSVIENKRIDCKMVSTDFKDSLKDMVVNEDNVFVLMSKRA